MNTNEFWANVDKRKRRTGERFGQAAFNQFQDTPGMMNLANEIRGTDIDPFYVDDKDAPFSQTIMDFADFVRDNL